MSQSNENILQKTTVYKNGNGHAKQSVIPSFIEHNRSAKPLISLIIPVYMEEKILDNTLQIYTNSILNKYNVELIISDGGSTDSTVEIAEKYTDKITIHKENRRQTIAEGRNKGAEVANGDILVFINGDTVPENIELFFSKISFWLNSDSKLNKYGALACTVTVQPDQKIFKDTLFYTIHNAYVQFLNSLGMGMGRGECQIVKTEIFKKTGGYNSQLTAGEDFDFYRRIAKHGKIGFARDIVVYESPRRFRRYGYLRIILSWLINSISVMMLNRSVSKEWEAVR